MRVSVRECAGNNAGWCDVVCRSHGLPTRFTSQLWVSLHRSPPYYPDAVTLDATVRPGDVLRSVDDSPGCSVKDSFAALDLAPAGFQMLFEAEWIHREPGPAPASAAGWRAVRTADELQAFAAAHGVGDVLRPELLTDPLVTVLVRMDGAEIVAGAIANRTGGVLGLSNVFGDDPWPGAVAAAVARYPDLPLVGYESGVDLDAARAVGFTPVGPLRVWLRPGP